MFREGLYTYNAMTHVRERRLLRQAELQHVTAAFRLEARSDRQKTTSTQRNAWQAAFCQ